MVTTMGVGINRGNGNEFRNRLEWEWKLPDGNGTECIGNDNVSTQQYWHSAGSLGWPFPMPKYKYIFQIKYTIGGSRIFQKGGGDFGNPSERSIEGVWACGRREFERS